jgi:hypothetical protein
VFLGKKDDRPTGERGTRIHRRPDGAIALRYHGTDVVIWYADGHTQLNSGGWSTLTTRRRMSDYSGVRIFSDRNVQYVGTFEGRVPFWDHMVLAPDADGLLVPQGNPPTTADRVRMIEAKLSAKIHKYIAGYGRQVEADRALRVPDGGDCWGCYFRAQNANDRQSPHGRIEPMGIDHYLSHFDDEYYVPSLYWNAIQARYGNPQLVFAMRAADIERNPARGAADVRRDLIGFFRRLKPELLNLLVQREAMEDR